MSAARPYSNGTKAASISPNRIPDRIEANSGLVIVPEIMARTAPA